MRCKIYYTSPRNVAEAIAQEIGAQINVSPERLNPAYMPEKVDLMFLGTDGSHPDDVIMDFIAALSVGRVRNAALFNANTKLSMRGIECMGEALKARGVHVLEAPLVCSSRAYWRESPNFDRAAVASFVNSALREAKKRNG